MVSKSELKKRQKQREVEKKKAEIKEIVAGWVLDRGQGGGKDGLPTSKEKNDDALRYRKGKHR